MFRAVVMDLNTFYDADWNVSEYRLLKTCTESWHRMSGQILSLVYFIFWSDILWLPILEHFIKAKLLYVSSPYENFGFFKNQNMLVFL